VSDELAGVENRIRVAAEDYNDAARVYNAARAQTKEPGAAERLGFSEEPSFKGAEGQPSEPKIRAVPPT
jgi:hypothetical protein